MHLRARWYHKSRSALMCLSFFCVTLLREALVYFYSLLRLQFTPFRVTQSAFVKARRHGSIYSLHDCKSFFLARIPSIFLKKVKSYLKTQLCDASSSSMVSQKQKRAFVFKLFLCNLFARSAGIFYALLSQLSSLTCLPI